MPKEHVIQPGDSLPRLAEHYYGDARKWPAIERASTFESGRGQYIKPGEIAIIPDLEGETIGDYEPTEVGDDDVSLTVGGRQFTGWTGVSITLNEDSIAAGFSLTAPFDPEREDLRTQLRPFAYRMARVFIGNELVLKGTIEKIAPTLTADDRSVTITGRSTTGAMVDCSIEGQGSEFRGQSLKTIVTWIGNLFGVTVVDNTADTGEINETRPEPGETAFDFVNRLAKSKGRLLSADPRGILTISTPSAAPTPVASITEGAHPLLSASADYDGTRRYSKYITYADIDGDPGLKGQAEDTGVAIYRPTRFEADANVDDLTAAAEWQRSLDLVGATRLRVTLAGWRRPDGKLWRNSDVVTAQIPSVMIYSDTRFRIAGATLRIDENRGRITELRLVLPEAYTREMPGAYPWD